MSGLLPFAAVVLVGAAVVAHQLHRYTSDPLGEVLARVLHAEVDDLEPTITCTPKEEGK